jgi:hypothetical protein
VPRANGRAVFGMLKELIWQIRCIAEDRSRRLRRCTLERFPMLGSFCVTTWSARFPIGRIYSAVPILCIWRKRRISRWIILRRTRTTKTTTTSEAVYYYYYRQGQMSILTNWRRRPRKERRFNEYSFSGSSRTISARIRLASHGVRCVVAIGARGMALRTARRDQEGGATLNPSTKCESSVCLDAFPFRTVDCRHCLCCPATELHQADEVCTLWSAVYVAFFHTDALQPSG